MNSESKRFSIYLYNIKSMRKVKLGKLNVVKLNSSISEVHTKKGNMQSINNNFYLKTVDESLFFVIL